MISFFSTIPAMADTNNRDRSESEALVPGVAGRGSRLDTPRPVGFPGTASLSPATPGDSADLCCVATSPPRSCERVSGPRYATLGIEFVRDATDVDFVSPPSKDAFVS